MTGLNQICNYLRDRIQIFVTPLQTQIWNNGPSPSGKASGFGLDIPRFESQRPSFQELVIDKSLLVLDFEGVIVDGIKEYWSSSHQTCLNICSAKEKEIISFSSEIPAAFKILRPWVHYGWEMVILAAECSDKTSQLNLKGIESFSKNYQIWWLS